MDTLAADPILRMEIQVTSMQLATNTRANSDAGQLSPCMGGPGLCVEPSGTARMGVVISLIGGTSSQTTTIFDGFGQQISTSLQFFDSLENSATISGGVANEIIDLSNYTSINPLAAHNDQGELWHLLDHSTGMIEWLRDMDNEPAPFIENYHQITEDLQTNAPPGHQGGGNTANGNHTWLHSIVTVHGTLDGMSQTDSNGNGLETRLIWDQTGKAEFFNQIEKIPMIKMSSEIPILEGDELITSTGWVPRNGFGQKSAWPIEVGTYVPEPASLSLIILGGLGLFVRRK